MKNIKPSIYCNEKLALTIDTLYNACGTTTGVINHMHDVYSFLINANSVNLTGEQWEAISEAYANVEKINLERELLLMGRQIEAWFQINQLDDEGLVNKINSLSHLEKIAVIHRILANKKPKKEAKKKR